MVGKMVDMMVVVLVGYLVEKMGGKKAGMLGRQLVVMMVDQKGTMRVAQ
jgi:hypothetical protein